MTHSLPAPSTVRTMLFAAMLAGPLFACAQSSNTSTGLSGSSTPPATGASSAPGDVVGGGGALDQTYREIYTPGDPRWSNEY